jgi:hypothetical protein
METRVTPFPSVVRHREHFLYGTVSNAKYMPSRNRSRRFSLGIWRSLKCFYPSISHFHHVTEIGRDGRVVLDHLPYCEETACSAAVENIRWGDNQGAVKEGQTSDALLKTSFILFAVDGSLDERVEERNAVPIVQGVSSVGHR